ncbi:ubiquitin-conjugating enzyme E2 T-like [Zeugodacus cucurbitae]|uniref:ubiquitin-conjugating enzyme E2 T-like n=1 Tax=Zeugodacus cucurbitae TaxID=28588 RepID=UPI0023D96706|nr:ubiquitin-conjugating enzyme E2 T-like [Zeugodacus cucurbitae]
MNNKIKKMRIPVELNQLLKNKSDHGISCVAESNDDNYSNLLAKVPGPKGSPYEDGVFKLKITFGTQYPFQPPTFKFSTPIYHPNIDNTGKICLDLLRMPPAGSYNPAITLESMLLSIQLLLASPNPDDPLNSEAADLYKTNLEEFNSKTRELVRKECSNDQNEYIEVSATKRLK